MFKLTLVTPEKKLVLSQDIEEVFVPGYKGELDVLPGHAPLLTTVIPGIVRYKSKGETKTHNVAVGNGYCQIYGEGVNVLVETAELPSEIDVERSQKSFKAVEQQLSTETLDNEQYEEALHKRERATARIEASKLK